MSLLYKIAGNTTNSNTALQTGMAIAAGSGAVIAADKIAKGLDNMLVNHKIPSIVRYAKHKYPDLNEVSDSKLKSWGKAIATLSPKLMSDKELGADSLYQVYQYGGRIDLASAKIMADITRGTNTGMSGANLIAGAASVQKMGG